MSVLLPIKMPKSCSDCPLCYDSMACTANYQIAFWTDGFGDEFMRTRHPLCPLKEEKVYTQREVAELLSEAIGDGCACNVNGNDEWLPYVCECTDKCPSPGGAECWVQYLKHLEERFDVLEKERGEE